MHNIRTDEKTFNATTSTRWRIASFVGFVAVGAWFVIFSTIPDPRPLSTPEWIVVAFQKYLVSSEPAARFVSTIILRGVGFGLLGGLLALATLPYTFGISWTITLVGAPTLAILSQWIHHGHFPLSFQIQLSLISSVIGGLAGLSLRRSLLAIGILLSFSVSVLGWGLATGKSNDLDSSARMTGLHLLSLADEIPDGDKGFAMLVEKAFAFAEDNSHRTSAIIPNQAAILALGIILGEERVAGMAGRKINIDRVSELETLRSRITLRGRHDLSRHFWVSAALTVLTDADRALTVGIGKEVMDSTPGGSGFSFVDLMADRAGIRFSDAATKTNASAASFQIKILDGLDATDYFPDIEGLPEGVTSSTFLLEYGGLGGAKTRSLNEETLRRLATCNGLAIEIEP